MSSRLISPAGMTRGRLRTCISPRGGTGFACTWRQPDARANGGCVQCGAGGAYGGTDARRALSTHHAGRQAHSFRNPVKPPCLRRHHGGGARAPDGGCRAGWIGASRARDRRGQDGPVGGELPAYARDAPHPDCQPTAAPIRRPCGACRRHRRALGGVARRDYLRRCRDLYHRRAERHSHPERRDGDHGAPTGTAAALH